MTVINLTLVAIALILLVAASLGLRRMLKGIFAAHTCELKKANDKLAASEKNLLLQYDNAPDMLLSLDVETQRVVRCNATTATGLGYSKEELFGMSRHDLYAPGCRARAEAAFREFLATGRLEDVELQVVCKDGSVIDVSLSATQYRDAGGDILYSDAIWRDITRRKQSEVLAAKRDRQLTTLYLMGEQMMLNDDLIALMHNVAYCLFESLSVRRVLICELLPGGRNLMVPAAIGIPQNYVCSVEPYPITRSSLPGRAQLANGPIQLSGRTSPHWLDGMHYLGEGEPDSGVASVLRDSGGAFGLIMAFHDDGKDFSQEDIDYIQSMGNLLSVAADRIQLRNGRRTWQMADTGTVSIS